MALIFILLILRTGWIENCIFYKQFKVTKTRNCVNWFKINLQIKNKCCMQEHFSNKQRKKYLKINFTFNSKLNKQIQDCMNKRNSVKHYSIAARY